MLTWLCPQTSFAWIVSSQSLPSHKYRPILHLFQALTVIKQNALDIWKSKSRFGMLSEHPSWEMLIVCAVNYIISKAINQEVLICTNG